MNEPFHSSTDAIVHDFEALIRYVAGEKIALTPKQKLVPLRHVKKVMEHFQVKESHEHIIGDVAYKKRDESEYPRFSFLDLLAIGGGFLKITGRNLLAKGPNWETFFAVRPEERGFHLFCALRYSFNSENWLMCGGDFGKQLEEKSEMIWSRMLHWSDGKVIDWRFWAQEIIRACGLRWNSIDQTHAEGLAIWGLGYCFLKPLEYFGLLVEAEKEGDDFARLQSFRLNRVGCDYFGRLFTKVDKSISGISPFSLN